MGYYLDELLPWRSPKEVLVTLGYEKRAVDDIYTVRFHMQSGKEHVLTYSRRNSSVPMLDLHDFEDKRVQPDIQYEHVEARESLEQTKAAYWQTKYEKVNIGAPIRPEETAEAIGSVDDPPMDLFEWPLNRIGYPVELWETVNELKQRDDVGDVWLMDAKAIEREDIGTHERYDRD